MLSRVKALTPTVCPVPIPLLRKHAWISQNTSDDLLKIYGTAATEMAEQACNRYFLRRSVQWTLTPDTRQSIYYSLATTLQNYYNSYAHPWIHCPHSAVSIDSVTYGVWGNPETVMVLGTDYQVDLATDPARIQLMNFGLFTPNVDHLTVSYTSGYGATSADVPMPIWQAIMLLTVNMNENRGEEGGSLWSAAAESLLAPYMVLQFGGSNDFYSA